MNKSTFTKHIKTTFEMISGFNQYNCGFIAPGERWEDQPWDFGAAFMVECGEAVGDHIGHKWWAKQTTDWDQALIEMVDAYHFAVGMLIQNRWETEDFESIDALAEEVVDIRYHLDYEGEEESELTGSVDKATIINAIKAMVSEVMFESVSPTGDTDCGVNDTIDIAVMLGYSIEQFFSAVIQKNVLNYFRADNGYREGKYTKIWDGREDNMVLREIALQNPEKACDPVFLRDMLNTLYTNLGLK